MGDARLMEFSHRCFSQKPMTVFDQNPESQRNTNLASPSGTAEVAAEFLQEPFHAAGGVRGAFTHPCREHLVVSARNAMSG